MEFIYLHLIDVYFMVKLEVDELIELLCMKNQNRDENFLDPWLKEAQESGFTKLWNYRDFTVRRRFMIGIRVKS